MTTFGRAVSSPYFEITSLISSYPRLFRHSCYNVLPTSTLHSPYSPYSRSCSWILTGCCLTSASPVPPPPPLPLVQAKEAANCVLKGRYTEADGSGLGLQTGGEVQLDLTLNKIISIEKVRTSLIEE